VNFLSDPIGDLVLNGAVSTGGCSNRANTFQANLSAPLGESHLVRYGIYDDSERAISNNNSLAFPADADDDQIFTVPIAQRP
jgi:hypothetical protein